MSAGVPIFVPFVAWTYGELEPNALKRVQVAASQGPWRLRRLRFKTRGQVNLGAGVDVHALTLGTTQCIAGIGAGAPRLRLADLDRMRFDQPFHIGHTCELELSQAADWRGATGQRVDMIATFVRAKLCRQCHGQGATIRPIFGGRSVSVACADCEGTGQR